MHWWADAKASTGGVVSCSADSFHLFRVEWNPSRITWLLDGKPFWVANIENGANGTEEFHSPFHILLNLAIGGDFPGFDIDTAQFPVKMYVDWVRVYGIVTGEADVPARESSDARLGDVYPNPSTASATITYQLPRQMRVRISIHDILGREVETLVDDTRLPGRHAAVLKTAGLRNGTYRCRLETDGITLEKILVVLR